ncbi:MAG: C45 family autoproteolytic acyltransferase/hydrolase [Thermoanaerobaculales bacterium]|jgi:hypothetical protein|nr:C45 family autoproteolytic acyltransferase/hydrolase [Thermoanaerobaculales bacterium]
MRPFLCLATLSVALAAVPAAADIAIPLVNPGFERVEPDGSVVGWTRLDRSTGGAAVAPTTEHAREGVGSLRLAVAGHGSVAAESAPIRLEVGRLYRLSGWIRTEGAVSDPTTRYPTAVPAVLRMASFPFTNHSPAVGGDSDWLRVETLFFATRKEDRVRLHLGHNGSARGSAWFDDILLEAVDDITEAIPLETVRWSGKGFRYHDRGWIVVHIEGSPYERGFQLGELVADEIAEYIRKLGVLSDEDDPEAGWKRLRFECDALFLRSYDEEYLREMKGIADGAAAAGAEAWGREIDLVDIVTVNSVVDLGQLEDAIEITPHALTGEAFAAPAEELEIAPEKHSCSAFAATGPATRDGGVVFGQIFMWGGYTGVHWNVIVDVLPTDGHRLVYQTFPGGIHSGADFYINSAGIVIGETTVAQTPWAPDSTPQSNRIRKAAQYASSIDDVERILWEGNNGMYTNDWPIADVKTGEVAILLLGTHAKKLWRTGEDMAPFGTPGFLWANNNNRDDEVRKEYLAQPDDRPFDLMFSPWNRDIAFNEFYREHAGAIDVTAAVELWASSPVNRAHACDGKITTGEMAEQLVFLAHHGKVTLREKFPTKGWRYLPDLPGAEPHLSLGYATISPVFVNERLQALRPSAAAEPGAEPAAEPADEPELVLGGLEAELSIDRDRLWRRTVLPASPAESWFVSASAAYWQLLDGLDHDDPVAAAEELGDALAGLSLRYLYTVSREEDLPASAAHRAYDRYAPYLVPRIKGTFALHQLRLRLGNERFLEVMRTVHERYAERPMSSADFIAVAEEVAGEDLAGAIRPWLDREGLPVLRPSFEVRPKKDRFQLVVTVDQDDPPYELVTHLEVTVGGERRLERLELAGDTEVALVYDERPTRVVFNVLDDIPVPRESFYTWSNFIDDFHSTLIVYGTARQIEANHTMARRWQELVADTYVEILPPLVKDAEIDGPAAASHDLMVLGTTGDNYLFGHLGAAGIEIGPGWFRFRDRTRADPEDGLFAVVPNPFNPSRVLYLIAANSAMQLHRMTSTYHREIPSWAVFEGAAIVEQGSFEPAGFVVELD